MYLGLDLAQETGWATWAPGDPRPRTGHLRLPRWNPVDLAPDFERLRKQLSELHAKNPIAAVWYEAPIKTKFDSVLTLRFLFGLANMVDWWCFKLAIPCKEVAIRDWRNHFLGTCSGGRDALKLAAREACELRGWSVSTDDEADAAGVLDYGLACVGADVPWRDSHLFGGRAAA